VDSIDYITKGLRKNVEEDIVQEDSPDTESEEIDAEDDETVEPESRVRSVGGADVVVTCELKSKLPYHFFTFQVLLAHTESGEDVFEETIKNLKGRKASDENEPVIMLHHDNCAQVKAALDKIHATLNVKATLETVLGLLLEDDGKEKISFADLGFATKKTLCELIGYFCFLD